MFYDQKKGQRTTFENRERRARAKPGKKKSLANNVPMSEFALNQ